jgi:membrane-bound lytic murein transglycosylase MltF
VIGLLIQACTPVVDEVQSNRATILYLGSASCISEPGEYTMTPVRKKTTMLVLIVGLSACSGGDEGPLGAGPSSESTSSHSAAVELPAMVEEVLGPFHGDFDALVEKREIRVLVTYNMTNFFLDGGTPRGITADALREFEKALNKELKLGRRPLQVTAVPVVRDQLFPFLEDGRGDIAIASLTITPERSTSVDFSIPTAQGISEVVVTGPESPALSGIDDLAGKKIVIRESSSYRESLEKLNVVFRDRGLEEIKIVFASEYLETEDLMEMTNAGLIEITIADNYLARFWSQVLPNIVARDDLAIATGGNLGWAIRKDATGLLEHVNRFVKANRAGRLLGNTLIKRYLQDEKYVKNALAGGERQRLKGLLDVFRKYGDLYNFDPLMLAAQAYQESRLDQSVVSRAGAVGIMQILPTTAASKEVGIPDVSTIDNNIHAGTKYLRHIVDQYFDDPSADELNRSLFAFASYNAGPSRIKSLRAKAAARGFDPNVWFLSVEVVVADEVGRETVQYVRNIFKYYTAYTLLSEQDEIRQLLMSEGLTDD